MRSGAGLKHLIHNKHPSGSDAHMTPWAIATIISSHKPPTTQGHTTVSIHFSLTDASAGNLEFSSSWLDEAPRFWLDLDLDLLHVSLVLLEPASTKGRLFSQRKAEVGVSSFSTQAHAKPPLPYGSHQPKEVTGWSQKSRERKYTVSMEF